MANGRVKALHCYLQFDIERSTSYAELVNGIAEKLGVKPHYPAWLKDARAAEHGQCSGQASQNLDLIADQLSLEWTIKNGELRMEPIGAATSAAKVAKLLSPFQAVAGALMVGAMRDGRNLAGGEYKRIARELDTRGINLLKNLEPSYRRTLAAWNQKHSRTGRAIHTWAEAIVSRSPIRRGATKTLNRADEVYRNSLAFGAPWAREGK